MATETNIENMEMLHFLCQREVGQLQKNLNSFLVDSARMLHYISSYCAEKNENKDMGRYVLMVYDSYMSNTQMIIDMARKFNIHLQLKNLNRPVADCWQAPQSSFTDYLQWNIYKDQHSGEYDISLKMLNEFGEKKENNLSIRRNTKLTDHETNKIDDQSKTSPPNTSSSLKRVCFSKTEQIVPQIMQKDLSDFVEGYEFTATISYVADYENLIFYICQLKNTALSELSAMFHLRQLNAPPKNNNEIFGVSIHNDKILRAIVYTDITKPSKSQEKVLLIDFGEVVILDNTCTLYQVPIKYQNVPAQAIKCVLLGVNFMQNDRERLSSVLRQNEFEKCLFKVIHNVDRVLNLLILLKDKHVKETNPFGSFPSADKTCISASNPFWLSSEEQDENPESTFAIKKTETTEEANNSCGQNSLHASQLEVKRSPENVKKSNTPQIDALVGSCVMVTVTHVADVESFYAQIIRDQDSGGAMKPLIWTNDKIPNSQRLAHSPQLNQLVLAKFNKDDCWYRAKVVQIYENNTSFKIFYVDYGNNEIVTLNHMAHCFPDNVGEPFRAVRCHLVGIRSICDNDEIRWQQAIDFISLIILNESFMVQILNKREHKLFVCIIDEEYAEVTNNLVRMGYAKELSNEEYFS